MTCSFFYLESAITKAKIVQICDELTRAFPNDAWAPQARYDGFIAASDTQYMLLASNNRSSWRWPHVSSNPLEAWAGDGAMAIPSGCRYQMTFFGLSATKLRAIKRLLRSHGFVFHRGKISAWREIRLMRRHQDEVPQRRS